MSYSTCSIDGCDKLTGMKGTARGWCSKHYNRWYRNGDPLVKTQRKVTLICTIDGCGKPHDGRGLCSAHLTNLRRHGTPILPRRKGAVVDGKKICADCGVEKPTEDFYPVGAFLQARCKPCAAVRAKKYRDSRAEIIRAQARAQAVRHAVKRRDNARRRRATIRTAHVEHVESLVVLDESDWTCGICGEDIPRVVLWPHPLSPSLDHIVPLASGGEHSYENTQSAHLLCNMSKGARVA